MGKEVVDIEIVQGVFGRLVRQNLMMDCTWNHRGRREGDKGREKERRTERQRNPLS